ncbi:MAG: hypothetical protein IPL40_13870 [Proteobacteria bacterium]|nr:hypothetical protein [Pseudomonadota bacterium]
MHRPIDRSHALNTVLALSCLTLLAGGCGGDRAGEIDPIDRQLQALERALPGKTGDQLAGLCLDYASICERAAGICLSVESAALERRCQAISGRCESNLSGFCTRAPTRRDASAGYDAGVSPDASAGYDAGVSRDATSSADSAVSRDSGFVNCRPLVARGVGDCGILFGFALETPGFGTCMPVIGCSCAGPDCGRLFMDWFECDLVARRCQYAY